MGETTNDAQIEFWNGPAGDSWVKGQAGLDRSLAPFSEAACLRADARAGERVIDVGCGCGTTTAELAANGASVWGIDISAPMLAHAKSRFADNANIAFSECDAAVATFTEDHDLIFSRFGVMFFAEPVPAFANLRTALVPGGRIVFVCWQSPAQNSWIALPSAAIRDLAPPQPKPDPDAPGPFAFASRDKIEQILGDAGYTDIQIESVQRPFYLGEDVMSAARSQVQSGPLGRVLMQMDEADRELALQKIATSLEPHQTDEGVLLEGATWLVSALNQTSPDR